MFLKGKDEQFLNGSVPNNHIRGQKFQRLNLDFGLFLMTGDFWKNWCLRPNCQKQQNWRDRSRDAIYEEKRFLITGIDVITCSSLCGRVFSLKEIWNKTEIATLSNLRALNICQQRVFQFIPFVIDLQGSKGCKCSEGSKGFNGSSKGSNGSKGSKALWFCVH